MNGTADSVVNKICHLHGLVDNTLPGKCSVTVNNDRDYLITVCISSQMLLGTRTTQYDGVNGLEVRGVS